MIDVTTLFERRMVFPNPTARERLDRLVGLDSHKDKLAKVLGLLVNPGRLRRWVDRHYPGSGLLFDSVLHRPPLVILAGDIGSGKTELAETIGDAVAREESIEVSLLPLSLSARGRGKVGEMTQLISGAFDFTIREAGSLTDKNRAQGAVILLVDEADALAQSRETAEMHHEDVSGVNAFIRGIYRLAIQRLPAAVIMCTNRFESLDPAVRRRAAELLVFNRPDEERRRQLLGPRLGEVGFDAEQVEAIVAATGPQGDRPGFTYSDLTQRLLPGIVLDAYPDRTIEPERAIAIAREMRPTPAFREDGRGRGA